jgi:hypothetical protein
VLALSLIVADVAPTAPNVGNANQKGGLLVFPDIRVDDGWNTLVRIQNDGNADAIVLCAWLDGNRNRGGLRTPSDPQSCIVVRCRDWLGDPDTNRFPTGSREDT